MVSSVGKIPSVVAASYYDPDAFLDQWGSNTPLQTNVIDRTVQPGIDWVASQNYVSVGSGAVAAAYDVVADYFDEERLAKIAIKSQAIGFNAVSRVINVYGEANDGTLSDRDAWVQAGGFIGDIVGTVIPAYKVAQTAHIAVKAAGVVSGGALGWGLGQLGELIGGYVYDNFVAESEVSATTQPIILDLDGDGVELVDVTDSSTFIDIDDDGFLENTGWLGRDETTGTVDDGILVIDLAADGSAGPDGQITSADEFVFTRHAEGATTDLEGLTAAFDDNFDGILDDQDSRWADFKVWQDLDLDGESDAGELKTLAELGITSFDLNGIPYVPADGEEPGEKDNVISAIGGFDKADGSVGTFADVGDTIVRGLKGTIFSSHLISETYAHA